MKFELKSESDAVSVMIDGIIDETAIFPDLGTKPLSVLTLDLGGIKLITSGGVRLWIEWIREIENRHPKLDLIVLRCPYLFIRQMVVITQFLPATARIQSVFIPFYCEDCDESTLELIEKGRHFHGDGTRPLTLPESKCKSCDQDMEVDVVPDQYFGILSKFGVK